MSFVRWLRSMFRKPTDGPASVAPDEDQTPIRRAFAAIMHDDIATVTEVMSENPELWDYTSINFASLLAIAARPTSAKNFRELTGSNCPPIQRHTPEVARRVYLIGPDDTTRRIVPQIPRPSEPKGTATTIEAWETTHGCVARKHLLSVHYSL